MDSLEKDIITEFNAANIILSFLFIFLDSLALIICFFFLKPKNIISKILRIKYILLIFMNIILRFLLLSKYGNISPLFKEFFFSLFYTVQFYLILTFIMKLFENINLAINDKVIEEKNLFRFCTIFFFLNISYEKILLSFPKERLLIIQYIIILICIFTLYKHLRNVNNASQNNLGSNFVLKNRIHFFTETLFFLSFILYSLYYILRIIYLFLDDSLIILYIKIFLIVIKEGFIYLIFFTFGAILYTINKDINYTNNNNINYDNNGKI